MTLLLVNAFAAAVFAAAVALIAFGMGRPFGNSHRHRLQGRHWQSEEVRLAEVQIQPRSLAGWARRSHLAFGTVVPVPQRSYKSVEALS